MFTACFFTINGMRHFEKQEIMQEYFAFLSNRSFPCIGAKAALAKQHISCMVADHMSCSKDDKAILEFLYSFVDSYRQSKEVYHSAVVIFKSTAINNEETFDMLLWQRLQALSNLDMLQFEYDKRVTDDPLSANFSFSLKEEAFFIIGLHPSSNRVARRFQYPALVFNPHTQFEALRKTERYDRMKDAVRKRDIALEGSVNPMLKDFGESSEAYQYSGRKYDDTWQCPLKINHGAIKHHSTS
jgi:FPC/CPF motif-containing protein YcgG